MTAPRLRAFCALLLAGTVLSACSSAPSEAHDAPGAAGTSAPALTGDVVVLAAASLTDVFTELAEQFEQENPDVTVTLSFGASSALVQQVQAGAPADVLATASTGTMDQVADLTERTVVFASNTLQIAVPAGNPGEVRSVADFANPDLTLALCAAEVPCGTAAAQMFEKAGVVPQPDTYEKDVSATLTKVELGEVDAAVVYRTDVIGAGDEVEGVDVPHDVDVRNDYPIAVLKDAPNPAAAAAFRDLILSRTGVGVLESAGFVVA